MKYRKLGNTGLIVSELALGSMQFGGKMRMGNLGQGDTTKMVKSAFDPELYTDGGPWQDLRGTTWTAG